MSNISVWGVDHGVEIAKDYDPNKSFRKQGMAYKDKPARKAVSHDVRRNAGLVLSSSPHRKENWKTIGSATGKGAAIGAGVGLAVRGSRGAANGGLLGAEVGSFVGQHKVNQRAIRRGVNTGLSNGNITTGHNPKSVGLFSGLPKKNR